MKFILILLLAISTTFASVNGPCSGVDGICIDTSKCSSYSGTSVSGKCPSDPSNIKCCDSISCSANGKTGKCAFASQCDGETVSGKCPGGSDFKCCLGKVKEGGGPSGDTSGDSSSSGGGKPSWYVNQNEHTKTICKIGGENKSVATSGCGIASLTMGIAVTTGNKLSPENLFKEGYDSGYYHGDGFSHDAISKLGKKHGVQVSWTGSISNVYSALSSGKGVIYHVGPDNKYHFTKGGHYIFLKGATTEGGIQKVYVFDPNGRNNYINKLFPLKKSDGGIEVAKKGTGSDFGIVSKN